MGLGDFLEGAGKAVGNVAKGAGWAVNPTHWDDIGRGVAKGAEFVVENPGKVWDIGFEVARQQVTDPTNIAINAGLLAATVATGGAAGGAWAARLGAAAARGGKTIDTAMDAVRAGKSVAKGIETAQDVAQGAQKLGRLDKFIQGSRAFNPIELRSGAGALRQGAAQKILSAGGEAPSLARQTTAALVQGSGRRAPTQLTGMSDEMFRLQKASWRVHGVERKTLGAQQTVSDVSEAVPAVADPTGYAMKQASAKINKAAPAPGARAAPEVVGGPTSTWQTPTLDLGGGAVQPSTKSYGPTPSYTPGRGYRRTEVDWSSTMPEYSY